MRIICHTWGCAVSIRMSACAAQFCPVCGNSNITIVTEPNDAFFGKDHVSAANEERNESIPHVIGSIVDGIATLKNAAYQQYSSLVDSIVCDHITEEREIERIMDGLLDFCDEERFIEIYRKLCRHIYYHYPELVGEHVALFRAQFETADEADEESSDSTN